MSQPLPFAEGERFHPHEVRISTRDSEISHFAIGEIYHCNTVNLRVDGIAHRGQFINFSLKSL